MGGARVTLRSRSRDAAHIVVATVPSTVTPRVHRPDGQANGGSTGLSIVPPWRSTDRSVKGGGQAVWMTVAVTVTVTVSRRFPTSSRHNAGRSVTNMAGRSGRAVGVTIRRYSRRRSITLAQSLPATPPRYSSVSSPARRLTRPSEHRLQPVSTA
jgi:hypothetical protein